MVFRLFIFQIELFHHYAILKLFQQNHHQPYKNNIPAH
ncbi:hypothetical protein Q7O_003231 [Pectobacterium carotovorum subsp. carotovorum PCCS1]|nr:hypothetical protein [Pectobacterium carotovorum subsp. carotovorum PCCS1]